MGRLFGWRHHGITASANQQAFYHSKNVRLGSVEWLIPQVMTRIFLE